jgi:hypothetical protein
LPFCYQPYDIVLKAKPDRIPNAPSCSRRSNFHEQDLFTIAYAVQDQTSPQNVIDFKELAVWPAHPAGVDIKE